ncbi:MAG: Omp28 family outer membrane lipoprotein [Bacteroidales bacterium]|nr:Omp28 family outer membrane lipoprotein [Lentimicrobiaceae bacterium]MDD5695081.1 Omp28 family outer membrane lipoprotein [Bacteroidales bacterium]
MKYIGYFSLFLFATFFLLSCDEMEAPYLTDVGGADTSECPVPAFPHIHDPVKRVLLEDYTGHLCVNCPTAAVTAHDLQDGLGDRLVVISIHAGFFATPMGGNYTTDFRTEAGTEWDTFFGISKVGNPNGMVDRIGYNSDHILSPGAWSNAIAQQLEREPELTVEIINEYQESDRKLCTHIQTVFNKETNRNLNLNVVIIEDEIIAPQKNNNPEVGDTPEILEYEHNHVLRGAVNTPWGVQIAQRGVIMAEDSEVTKSYKYYLNEAWDPYKCKIVAFAYDADTYEVLQVSQVSVR